MGRVCEKKGRILALGSRVIGKCAFADDFSARRQPGTVNVEL